MRKPKTGRLQKKKGFKRAITLQEAFDVVAEELVRRRHHQCAFISRESCAPFHEAKIDLHVLEDGAEISVVKSSKTALELERSV
ncbi:hypothetical protein J7E26_01440 [Bacillus sp. ISL-51]|uniref:hypothetical protein n=1 Tax=Bacteria TaxID=2 RepID=UPI00112B3C9C|nr:MULTISPECIES: hypothetical protein [Bacteria]MBT2572630.1 hypothetical protein [Bacillus sp. ISL-51]MBT2711698.1 hypothetical protein [Pseudomonas sp. ISL-88]